MFGKLIRLLTFNYLTLGWWLPPFVPKWVRVRRKMNKPSHWEVMAVLRRREEGKSQALKEARRFLQEVVPWYSPKEINLALKYLSKGHRVFIPCMKADVLRSSEIDKKLVRFETHVGWNCCGGEWQEGDCGCTHQDLAGLRFPFQPQPRVTSLFAKEVSHI